TYTARLQAQYAKQLPVPSDLFYLGGRYSIKGIKEGNYLSGEHGFSLSQELAWQLPLQNLNQHFSTNANSAQLYVSIDQGYVYGKNTLNNQRHILAGAVGMRYYFQGSQDPRIQETQNGLTYFKESNTYLNNIPTTAHLD
ncbi:ShlB/FhaC/HecB family hemolysin secretion/activation protein, partial [Azoarcus indigens]|nr:ShlB/FhaC/HecB family hemolysin secretion/activation protein [Azoarcus indigens]